MKEMKKTVKNYFEKYNEINRLLSIDGIKHCWSEFSETILLPNKNIKKKLLEIQYVHLNFFL